MANGRRNSSGSSRGSGAVGMTRQLGKSLTRTARKAASSSSSSNRGSGPSRGSRSSARSTSSAPSRNTRSSSMRPGRNRNR